MGGQVGGGEQLERRTFIPCPLTYYPMGQDMHMIDNQNMGYHSPYQHVPPPHDSISDSGAIVARGSTNESASKSHVVNASTESRGYRGPSAGGPTPAFIFLYTLD